MENKAHALAAGLFVLALTILLAALAYWLTRDVGTRREYEIATREAISGLQPQAAVRYRGVNVGKVTSIGFDPESPGQVLLTLSVDDKAPITEATFAVLGYQGVTGLAFIDLDDAGRPAPPLSSTDSAVARIPLRPGLLARLGNRFEGFGTQAEELAARANRLLTEDNQRIVMQSAAQVGEAALGVQRLARDLNTLLDAQFGPQRMSIPELVQKTSATMQALESASAQLTQAARQVGAAADSVGASASAVGQAAEQAGSGLQRLQGPGGLLDRLEVGTQSANDTLRALGQGTLPRVNRLGDDVSRAARQLSRTAEGVRDNPQVLLWGAGAIAPGPGEPGFSAPAAATPIRP